MTKIGFRRTIHNFWQCVFVLFRMISIFLKKSCSPKQAQKKKDKTLELAIKFRMFFLYNSKLNFETECNSILCSAASLDSIKYIVMGVLHSMYVWTSAHILFFSYLRLDVTSIIIEGTGGTEEKAIYPVTTILIAYFWNKTAYSAANIRNSLSIFNGWSRFNGSCFSRGFVFGSPQSLSCNLNNENLELTLKFFFQNSNFPFHSSGF